MIRSSDTDSKKFKFKQWFKKSDKSSTTVCPLAINNNRSSKSCWMEVTEQSVHRENNGDVLKENGGVITPAPPGLVNVTELHAEDMTPPSLGNGHAGHNDQGMKAASEIRTSRKKSAAPKAPTAPPSGDSYLDGPDQVIPTESIFCCVPDGAVRLRMSPEGQAAKTPVSVVTVLRRTADKFPNRMALCEKIGDSWQRFTFREYRQQVLDVAKAFIKLGLEPFHSVCILGFNSPEWFISDLAAIHAGSFAAGIYTTNGAEACHFCAENSRANIIVVEDEKQLAKILQIRDRLPLLKAVIQYKGKPSAPGVLSWEEVLKIGQAETDELLNERIKRIAVNQCCTLVYTSGTTGNPKGVMLTHDNLTWDADSIASYLNVEPAWEDLVSYLPLSHVAAQVVDIYLTILYAVTVHFAQPDALKGSLIKTLQEVRPTKFLGVPRVWEKMYEKMMDVGRETTGLKKTIGTWAKRQGFQHHMDNINGTPSNTFSYSLANKIVFSKIKQALGLERCSIFASAAAPLAVDVVKYFMSLDIPIMECYGMSEASGAHTINRNNAMRLESVGRTLPGMKTMLFEQDERGHGEICMSGRHVFMGYLNAEEKTREALDAKGWLHSGDIGRTEQNEFIYITGRIKELLITAGGENVAPVPIEDVIKSELSVVSNAMLIGDRRKFLSILLTLKTDTNLDTGEPLDTLSSGAKAWCQNIGSSATTVTEIISGPDEKVMKAIEAGIVRYNKQAESNAKKIQKFKILPKDFSIPGGELGPTMKVKRNVVHDQYSQLIEEFYE